jgi:osmotically inducible lipoprotein OsmB
VWHQPEAARRHALEHTMNSRLTHTFGLIALSLSLGACSGMTTRDKNTATGAVLGGAAGAILGGGAAGTIGGAAVGGVIGNQVDK